MGEVEKPRVESIPLQVPGQSVRGVWSCVLPTTHGFLTGSTRGTDGADN